MILLKRIQQQFVALITTKHLSPRKIALSWAMGCYIAFSPFPGAHTVIMVAAHYLFKLHFPILFIATSINNPWTAIPCYLGGYRLGHWILHSILGYGPLWEISLLGYGRLWDISLSAIFGSGSICLWSFFVGGNILGITVGLVSYPLMLFIARSIRAKASKNSNLEHNV